MTMAKAEGRASRQIELAGNRLVRGENLQDLLSFGSNGFPVPTNPIPQSFVPFCLHAGAFAVIFSPKIQLQNARDLGESRWGPALRKKRVTALVP